VALASRLATDLQLAWSLMSWPSMWSSEGPIIESRNLVETWRSGDIIKRRDRGGQHARYLQR
jgi:hypothetical protein